MVVFNWIQQGKEIHCYADKKCIGFVKKYDKGYPVLLAVFIPPFIPAIVEYGTTFDVLNAQSMVQQLYLAYFKGLLNGYLNGEEKWYDTVGYRIAQQGMYMTYYNENEYTGISSRVAGYGIY